MGEALWDLAASFVAAFVWLAIFVEAASLYRRLRPGAWARAKDSQRPPAAGDSSEGPAGLERSSN